MSFEGVKSLRRRLMMTRMSIAYYRPSTYGVYYWRGGSHRWREKRRK